MILNMSLLSEMNLPVKSVLVTGVNIVFAVIVFLTFLRGFFRGVRKSLFYTLFFALGAVGMWFAIAPLANTIYTMDLSSVGPIETNIQDYIHSLVDQNLEYQISEGTYSYEAINGVVLCVLHIALFLIFAVFWIILYRFIIWFFWGIIGRPFLKIKKVKKASKENRALAKTIKNRKQRRELLKPTVIRKKKHRLLGGLVGTVNGLIMATILCVPLGGIFSIIDTASTTAASLEEGTVDENITDLLEYGDVYEQTWMAKLLNMFGEDGLDSQMFDELFTIEASKEEKVKLRGEVNTLAKFALQTSQSGIMDVDMENPTPEAFQQLETKYIVDAFKTLGELKLLDIVLNVGVDFLEYSDFINEHETMKNLFVDYDDLRAIKLTHDIAAIGTVVEDAIELLSTQADINNIDYTTFEQEKLAELVTDIFEIDLINVGINTGLSYVLALDEVVDFVGDHQVNYENIDWKKDLLSLVNMYTEIIDVCELFVGQESISVSLIAQNSDHVQNIIDCIYSLDVFNEVKEIAVDFALDSLGNNESISKYIPEEVFTELRENGSDTLFHELSTVINLFKDLDEKTTLLKSLDDYLASEDEDAKFVLDIEPALVNILADYIDESDIAQPIVLNFAKISNDSLQEQMGIDLYGALSNVEDLSEELRIVGHILEGIEAEGGSLNEILTEMTSQEQMTTIDLALIDGIINEEKASYKDEKGNVHYYIDDSELLKRIVGPILDNAMSDLLQGETLFADDDFVWSKEIKLLSELATTVSETSGGEEGKLNIESLKSSFETQIHMDVLKTLKDNSSDSLLVDKVLKVALSSMSEEEGAFDNVTDWSVEIDALYQVGNTLANEEGYLVIADLKELNKVKVETLEVASQVAGNSELIKVFFKEPLAGMGVDSTLITNWGEELTGLTNIVKTIAVEENGEKVIYLDNIQTSFENEIPLATLEAAKDVFASADEDTSTVIVTSVLSTALSPSVVEEGFFEGWTNANWGAELSALYDVASTMANSEGNLVIAELSNLTTIKVATIDAAALVIDDSTIAQSLFKKPLQDSMGVDTTQITSWSEELSGLSKVASTIAVEQDDELVLDINNIETQLSSEIPLATLGAARDIFENGNENTSTVIVRTLLEDSLSPNLVEEGFFEGWTNANWGAELSALYDVASTIAVEQDDELVLDINNIETQLSSEIPLATLEATRDIFKDADEETSTVIVRTLFVDALQTSINEPGFFDGWTNNKWYAELSSLTDIAATLATDSDGEQVLSVSALSEMKTLYISTLDSMVAVNPVTGKPHIDTSDILQYMAKDGFASIIGEDKVELIGTEGYPSWSDEVTVIKAMTEGNTYSNSKGEYIRLVEEPGIDEVSIDKKLTSESSNKVKWSVINTASLYVENSLVLQTILEEPFKTMLGEDTLNWDGTRWEIEVCAVASVTEDLQDSEGYVSMDLAISKIKVSVLEKASENTRSLIIRKMMSDTLTPMYASEDASQTPAHWESDDRWEKEITALYEIISPLQDSEGYINISTSFLHREVKLAMFDAMVAHISYSTVLQSKIAQEVYTEAGARIAGTPVVTFGSKQWQNEMMAIDQILRTIPEDYTPDAIVSYDSIDFVNIKFVSLEAVKDNIHRSIFIQHKMYISLDGMVLEDDTFAQYDFTTEAQWYNEVDVLISVAKAYVGAGKDVIKLDEISFGGSIKFTVLDVIAESLDKTTFIQSKFRDSMYVSGSGYIAGTPEVRYGETKWLNEAIAIDKLAQVLAHGEEAVGLNMFNFSNDSFGIPVDLLDTLMIYTDYSVYVQANLVLALDGIVVKDNTQDGVQVGTQLVYPLGSAEAKSTYWYKELEALKYVATELAGVDGVITTSTIDFESGINMSVILAMKEHIHHSTYLQNKLDEALFVDASVKPEVLFSLSETQWNKELNAIYEVGSVWFGVNGSINPSALGSTLDSGFPITVLEALSNVIHESLYFQNQLQPKLIAMAPSGYYTSLDIPVALPNTSNNNNDNWTNDLTALYKAMNAMSAGGNIQFNLSFASEIDYSLLTTLVDSTNGTPIIGKSKLLQALLKDTIDSLGTMDQTRTDINGTEFKGFEMALGYEGTIVSGKSYTVAEQWIVELSSIVTIAQHQVNAQNKINLSSLSADNFDRAFLATVVAVLDSTNTTSYGMPVELRAIMIPVLEGISRTGITFETGFNWATTATVTSDLQYLLQAFDDLGLTTIDQFNKDEINLMQAYSLVNEYGSKSILIKAIAENIIAELLA